MAPGERAGLLQSIATTVADYRQGEIAPMTPGHIDRWVRQFAVEEQPIILAEMDRILKAYYVSRQRAEWFFRGVLTSEKIFGPVPPDSLQHTKFLRIQRKGGSQNDLLDLADGILRSQYGLDIDACGATPTTYLYLDDCLYTGNTAFHDLREWL
ncbi:MAG TPA: hypothetical protein VFW96_27210, partial [Thermomicrobiales bacterium]|nr:hypothetical protein [Thermomicrobiales bacterium]